MNFLRFNIIKICLLYSILILSVFAGEYDDLIGMVDENGREITSVQRFTTSFIYCGQYRTRESVRYTMVQKDESGAVTWDIILPL